MPEEAYTPEFDLESWGSWEWGREVSPEDLVRVQENMRDAKKAAWNTAKSSRTNKQYALMLSFVFKYVNDERLLGYVYELMTKYQIDTISIFGHFLPHLQQVMDIAPYQPLYQEMWNEIDQWKPNLSIIWAYYRDLLVQFPQLDVIPQEYYTDMVMHQLSYFESTWELDKEKQETLRKGLEDVLFGS